MKIMDSIAEAAFLMPPEMGMRLIRAAKDFDETGAEPDFSAEGDLALRCVWVAVRPVMERSRSISSSRSDAGARGGRPRKQSATDESKENQNAPVEKQTESNGKQTKATVKQTKAEEEGEEEKDLESMACAHDVRPDPLGEPARAARCPVPTPSEVEAYVAASGGHPISGEDFVAWYDDHGWPPRGWHGSAMRWSRRERDRAAQARVLPFKPRGAAGPAPEAFEGHVAPAVDASELFGEAGGDAASAL